MKKVLIALLALTGVAAAEPTTLSSALYASTNGTSITTATTGDAAINGSFSLTVTLNPAALSSIFGSTSDRPTYFYVDTTRNTYVTVANALNNTGFVGMAVNNLDTYAADGTGDPARRPFTINGSTPATNAFANNNQNSLNTLLDSLTSAALTLSHTDKNSTSLYVTLNFADASSYELYGKNTDLKWSTGAGYLEAVVVNPAYVQDTYLFAGAVDQETAFALNTAAISNAALPAAHNIPEPATATLSLLALCGLAARRRRR